MNTLWDYLQEKTAAPEGTGAGVKEKVSRSHPTPATIARVPLIPPARRNAPIGTSSTAADRMIGHASNLRVEVLDHITDCGPNGSTDDEGEAVLGMRPQTYTPRRGELVKLGLVADSGRRRPTSSGRPAAVWVARRFADTRAPAAVTGTIGGVGGE